MSLTQVFCGQSRAYPSNRRRHFSRLSATRSSARRTVDPARALPASMIFHSGMLNPHRQSNRHRQGASSPQHRRTSRHRQSRPPAGTSRSVRSMRAVAADNSSMVSQASRATKPRATNPSSLCSRRGFAPSDPPGLCRRPSSLPIETKGAGVLVPAKSPRASLPSPAGNTYSYTILSALLLPVGSTDAEQ